MKKIILGLTLCLATLSLTNQVKAANTWDGQYQVTDYNETCEPPIYLQSGFSVADNQVINLYGPNGDISADGTGRIRMDYSSDEYVYFVYAFSEVNGYLQANVTWSSTSYNPSAHPSGCRGTLVATAISLNISGILGGGFDWTGDTILIFALVCGGTLIFVLIIVRLVRGASAPGAAAPVAPATTPAPAVVAPTAPPAPPAETPSAPAPSRRFLPGSRKIKIPKKGKLFWPELSQTRRKK